MSDDDRGWYPDDGAGPGDRGDRWFGDPQRGSAPGYPQQPPRPSRPVPPGPYRDRGDAPRGARPPADDGGYPERPPQGRPYIDRGGQGRDQGQGREQGRDRDYGDRRDPAGPYGGSGRRDDRGYGGEPGAPGRRRAQPPEDVWTPGGDAARESGQRSRRAPSDGPDPWSPGETRGGGRRAGAASGAVGTVNEDLDLDEIDPSGKGRGRGKGGRPLTPRAARRKKIIKWTSIGVATTLVAVLGVGAYVVIHLSGNIKHTALLQNGVTQAPEPVDPYGNSPMNVLVIGSDTRDTAADCKLGGDCGTGANADVEMLVHLSADRSNATIMSIPRDTETTLPACTDTANKTSTNGGEIGQINSTLQWGPSCTVTAVHDLTGLTIDHFIMVDFSGVIAMSDALGGVPVCVSNNMYDSYSGLRLHAGNNIVEGQTALEFVRTRHGFYDGSDLGREKSQHYFLSAMIRQVRAHMNLSDFTTLYGIANAATKALTVDDGLSGVTGLMGLATTMNKVPTDRITFVTMPWLYDPTNNNRVIAWQPEAGQMFANIKNDVPYSGAHAATAGPASGTSASASPSASPSAGTPAVVDSEVHVQIENGSGVSGRAASISQALVAEGFADATENGNAGSTATTVVYYPSDRLQSAQAVVGALGLPASSLKESGSYSEVTVVLGSDWTSGSVFTGAVASAGATPSTAASAPADSSAENASQTGGCVPVSPEDIVK
jgi:LCP family protein required for cell wall assembly